MKEYYSMRDGDRKFSVFFDSVVSGHDWISCDTRDEDGNGFCKGYRTIESDARTAWYDFWHLFRDHQRGSLFAGYITTSFTMV